MKNRFVICDSKRSHVSKNQLKLEKLEKKFWSYFRVRIKALILRQNSNWTGNCSGKLWLRSRRVPQHRGTREEWVILCSRRSYTPGLGHLLRRRGTRPKCRGTLEEHRNCGAAVDKDYPGVFYPSAGVEAGAAIFWVVLYGPAIF